ncbi:MAG: FAD-binding protein, partial [Chloroflexota bacterium]
WDPVNMERSSRAIISRSIFHEIKAGKTSPHGGVYTNIIHQPKSYIDEKLAEFAESHTFVRFDKAGIDLHNDSIETGYAMHYCQGGCDINTRCETDLPGLYAIGEVSSGGDGADRMTANSLPFCMCMGIIGGGEAADKASKTPMPEVDPEAVRGLVARALAPLQRPPGTRVASVRPPLQEIMAKETEYGRTEAGLKAALAEVKRYQKEVLPRLFVPNRQPRLNAEWLSVLEMENMVLVAECIIRNAMLRTESRGLHDRLDYPDPSPDWFRNIHLRLADGKLKQWTVPVEFTYYRPEPGSLGEPLKKSVPVKEYRGWRAEPIYKVPKLARHGALS